MVHGSVGCNAHTVYVQGAESTGAAHLLNHRIDRLIHHCILQLLASARFHRLDNTVDNIRAIANLTVSG